MTSEGQLLLWIVGVHVLGLAVVAALLIPALRDRPDRPGEESDSGSDDGWGNHPRRPVTPPGVPGGGLPLPDATPARLRLRDHRRLHERLPGPARRHTPEPARRPARVPHGARELRSAADTRRWSGSAR
jgi:hypothetical protein